MCTAALFRVVQARSGLTDASWRQDGRAAGVRHMYAWRDREREILRDGERETDVHI